MVDDDAGFDLADEDAGFDLEVDGFPGRAFEGRLGDLRGTVPIFGFCWFGLVSDVWLLLEDELRWMFNVGSVKLWKVEGLSAVSATLVTSRARPPKMPRRQSASDRQLP